MPAYPKAPVPPGYLIIERADGRWQARREGDEAVRSPWYTRRATAIRWCYTRTGRDVSAATSAQQRARKEVSHGG